MCLNSEPESGGYLMVGGIDTSFYDEPINWLKFSKVNQQSVIADSISLDNTYLSKKYITFYFC